MTVKTSKPSKTKPASTTEPTPKSRRLELEKRPGVTEDRLIADLVAEGEATNASNALRFVHAEHGELSLTDMLKALHAQGEAINRGDLSAAERMLNSQAVVLNAIFGELARRAALNMGTHLGATESYMRLALKAQSQSRATVEALASLKHPPLVFARQANINNGGQQQVNNGAVPPLAAHSAQARASAHAPNPQAAPTELLEAIDVQRVDTGATSSAGGADQELAAVGELNRAAHR